jgi:hypothetical protein
MANPAKAPKISIEEKRKLAKEACIKNPCTKVYNKLNYPCTFCPNEKIWLNLHKKS